MTASIRLFKNELYFFFVDLRRHYVESIAGVLLVSALFLGVYYGLRSASGTNSSDLDGLLVGYLCWGVAGAAYNSIARIVADESKTGTLEQLYLSAYPFRWIMVSRAIVHMISGFCSAAALIVIAMACTGRMLHLPIAHTLVLLLVSSLSLVGVGLFLGGVALINKRLQTMTALFNLVLLAVVSVPAYPMSGFAALPFSLGASAVRAIAKGNSEPTPFLYLAIVVNSMVYLVVGVVAYTRLERRAKDKNLLGLH